MQCLIKLMMLNNDVQYTTFKMFVTQMSNYLFVISFQLVFSKTLRYRLARANYSVAYVSEAWGDRKFLEDTQGIEWIAESPSSVVSIGFIG